MPARYKLDLVAQFVGLLTTLAPLRLVNHSALA